jgi:hypothetical protein
MGLGVVNLDVGKAFGFLDTLIDKIFPDKTEAEKIKLQIRQQEMSGELEEFKTKMSLFIAEASSQDKWTSRARPSFLYVMYIFILFGIPVGILSIFNPTAATAIGAGLGAWLKAIPEAMWAVFGVSFSAYTLARSYDKGKASK